MDFTRMHLDLQRDIVRIYHELMGAGGRYDGFSTETFSVRSGVLARLLAAGVVVAVEPGTKNLVRTGRVA